MEEIIVQSTSRKTAEAEPIVMRLKDAVRLVFIPTIVKNTSQPEACVKGTFVYQKKKKNDEWESIKEINLNNLRAAEGVQLEIKSAELLSLLKKLGDLYRIYRTSGVPQGKSKYVKVSKELEGLSGISEEDLREFLKLNSNTGISLFRQIANWLSSVENTDISPQEFVDAFQKATPAALQNIGVAAKFVQYKTEFHKLKGLVEKSDPSESSFQNHLQKNPWMFGSEYSEILDRRKWARDDNLDFMLRRTVDNYLEIIEIKTPATMPLFNYDKSHDSYYASAKLSEVIGQVYRYIEEVERSRDAIIAKDKVDPLKIRAKIIIGVDAEDGRKSALRTMNSHLHRVEIITYDQLLRVAKRTLDMFESQIKVDEDIAVDEIGDIPL